MKKGLILGMAGILFLVSCGAKEKASSSCDACHGSVISESSESSDVYVPSSIYSAASSSAKSTGMATSSSIAQSSTGSVTVFSSVAESKADSTAAASTSDAGETTTSSDEGSWLPWV